MAHLIEALKVNRYIKTLFLKENLFAPGRELNRFLRLLIQEIGKHPSINALKITGSTGLHMVRLWHMEIFNREMPCCHNLTSIEIEERFEKFSPQDKKRFIEIRAELAKLVERNRQRLLPVSRSQTCPNCGASISIGRS